jgi:hypothetical protein
MDRLRSTKLRARRIELDYFTRRAPLRTWRVVLSVAAFAAAGAWMGLVVVRNRREAFQPGPVSPAHAPFGVRCESCHDGTVQAAVLASPTPRWRGSTDAACRRCHDVADHHRNAGATPACGRCHVEHRGAKRLARIAPGGCIACHGDLDAHAGGEPRVVATDARAIRGFARNAGHPEFAVGTGAERVQLDASPSPRDDTALALDHRLHLEPGLRGPTGPVQLRCEDCHQGAPGDAADMAPVTFARHCAPCHPNTFDPRFPALPAPHDRPEVVHAFLRGLYVEHAGDHPEALVDGRRRVLGREAAPVASGGDWATEQAAQAEDILFRDPKRCGECHRLAWAPGAALPTVAPTRIPARWFAHATFEHAAHRAVACGECHAAATSEATSDVLLPRADTCRACHHAGGASDRCSTCHTYHPPAAAAARHTVRDLATGSSTTSR